jgi:4-amino-4-deoxy-L-arabinose transferase-like glycosyltransferase
LLLSAALIVRLGGYGPEWLPRAGHFLLLLVLVHAADILWHHPASADWPRLARAYRFELALAAIGLAALVMRLTGFGLDLGHSPLDIDEDRLAGNVKHFFVTGELRHDTVEHYPGLVFWMFSGAEFLSYLRGLTRGLARSPAELSLDRFVYSARMANVYVGVAIVLLTGLVGRHVVGKGAALLAALIVAIVPLSTGLTLVRNDPGMVAAALGAVLVALAHMHNPGRMWAFWAGALAGIAGAIKYSSVFAIVPVLLASWNPGAIRKSVERAMLALAGFVIAVAITNHFIWYDFPNFLRQLSDQIAITGRGHWAATDNPASFYVAILDRFGVGWVMLVFAAAFAAVGLASRDRRLWIFLSFPILYFSFMTGRPSQFPRWVFPLLPFVAIAGCGALAAAIGFVRRVGETSTTSAKAARLAVAGALAVAVLWHPLWSGVVTYSRAAMPPTHIVAEAWIEQNVPAGDTILLGEGWLALSSATHRLKRVPELRPVLDGGIGALAGSNWVVVSEQDFGHPTLRSLGFVRRFQASQGFGGSVGYDYEIYAVPKLPDRQ